MIGMNFTCHCKTGYALMLWTICKSSDLEPKERNTNFSTRNALFSRICNRFTTIESGSKSPLFLITILSKFSLIYISTESNLRIQVSIQLKYFIIKGFGIFVNLYISYIGLKSTNSQYVHILATQMIGDQLYSLHSDCTLEQWNINTGKLVQRVANVH